MFKNTNHFFKKVFKDSVSQIDQDNYVNAITDNHNLEKLKTLYSDLEVFAFFQHDILESEIDSLQIKNKIEDYQKEGKEVPYSTRKNIEYEIAKRKKLPLEGIPETKQILDLEKMFFQLEMYSIRRLKHKIGSLIRDPKKQNFETNLFQQSGAVKLDEVFQNPHETIFKDDFAFLLFEKMKGFYSNQSTVLANYSFLFYVMHKDGFVICGNIDFVKLLSTYNINIDRIDPRQSGTNKKTNLYNATKESLQKRTV